MKKQLKKWLFRLLVTILLISSILLVIILNPFFTYAYKSTHNNFTVYHNNPLDSTIFLHLDNAAKHLTRSDFNNEKLKLDICLNDNAIYPVLVQKFIGRAFAWGFYNKVVIYGNINSKGNYAELNGYKWNLTELLAHEMTHCLQFNKLGLLQSNPFAEIPTWKWEGYAEYIARQNSDQGDLTLNIERLLKNKTNEWGIAFNDSTIAPADYYNYWLLMQYSINIKGMSWRQILVDTSSDETVKQRMMKWYETVKNQ